MTAKDKIEIYEEVKAIREHFVGEVLSKLYIQVNQISWPGEIRAIVQFSETDDSVQFEDVGFQMAKAEALKVVNAAMDKNYE